ncbi:MAG TPA: hypothetical protein VH187_08050 [Scandinavium sp.]|jgi:hypothetical protein|uniref:hypothetical protein n=1 Tax=Scandinavium sp. TaxID=2830653 RepID=UPI002E32F059|nr:hypothetical protein [Scandinavium sp.]HEX4501097.1 hypothetical protein [Scandinavium sp.]
MPVSDYTPTTSDVAFLLRARTRDANGNITGDFTDDVTVPGETDAAGLIDLAADEVGEAIGPDIDTDFWESAKAVIVILAAANIELSYFPEQAAANNSMYDKLMARFDVKLKSLQADVAEAEQEEEMEESGSDSTMGISVAGGFPMPLWWGSVQW